MPSRARSPRRSSSGARARKASPGRASTRSQPRGNVVFVDQLQENALPARYECTSTGVLSNPTRVQKPSEVEDSSPRSRRRDEVYTRMDLSSLGAYLMGWFHKIFLPEGYPKSVSHDYLPYQIWDTVQAFCSTVTGILASKAALAGLGVGNVEARVGAALYFTIVKRNIGKVSRIVFTTAKGSDLDNNAKTWRVVADVLNDLASGFELLAPALCVAGSDCSEQWRYSLVVISAEVFRSVVGVAGGASRAALTQHFAVNDNYGDVNAKDGSQEMFVEIVGSYVGFQLSQLEGSAVLFFLLFTFFHVAANVMACRAVALLTINRQRLHILASRFLADGTILTPAQVAAEESVVFFGGSGVRGASVRLGAALPALAAACDLPLTIRRAARRRYIVAERNTSGVLAVQKEVLVGVHAEASAEDLVAGYMHGYLLTKGGHSPDVVSSTVEELLDELPAFGWRLDAAHVGGGTTRLSWDTELE